MTTTTTTIKKEPESFDFKDILLPKRIKKKSFLLAVSKANRKKFKKIRHKKNDELKFIKQVPMHPRDKIKNLTDDNEIEFIKQVPLHPCKRLKHLTRDMYNDRGNFKL